MWEKLNFFWCGLGRKVQHVGVVGEVTSPGQLSQCGQLHIGSTKWSYNMCIFLIFTAIPPACNNYFKFCAIRLPGYWLGKNKI